MHSLTDIPEKEPTEITAGDTVKWKRSLDHYKASDAWVLSYVITGQNGRYGPFQATADGDKHSAIIAASETAKWKAGNYTIEGYVSKGSERYMIYRGMLKVNPDLAAATGAYDNRSHVKKVLDAINAIIEGRATREDIDTVGRAIKDRNVSKNPELLLKWKFTYERWYQQELETEKVKQGLGTGRRILHRFI